MDIVAVGIDFANKLFALHDLEQSGKALLIKPRVACSLLLEAVTQTPLRLSGTKACTGARHAARGAGRGDLSATDKPSIWLPRSSWHRIAWTARTG